MIFYNLYLAIIIYLAFTEHQPVFVSRYTNNRRSHRNGGTTGTYPDGSVEMFCGRNVDDVPKNK
jgi:hypothetical protein